MHIYTVTDTLPFTPVYCITTTHYSHIGDEWLVTDQDTESYIPDVTEVLVKNPVKLYIKCPHMT